MKRLKYLAIVMASALLAGCNLIGPKDKEPMYQLSDLQGLWLETQVRDMEHYVRFTTEQSDETGYLYGREWDEAEDVFEEDLQPHGNGWFKYKFEIVDGKLTEIHLMDNGGAEIPKIYVVSKLTDTELNYYEKEYPAIKFYFEKVVEQANQ